MLKDKITEDRIKTSHPKVREELMKIWSEIDTTLTSGTCRAAYVIRTFEEQDGLYAQGRTKLYDAAGKRLGIVTQAKGGQSIHNYGLAVDIVLLENGGASWDVATDFDHDGQSDWMEVVKIFKNYGWSWGGDWKFTDKPHFEKPLGYTWQQLLDKHVKGDFIPGTNFVNI
jgi:peptidoglycan L-alanyl-D-glutamate endopeptidase CwlK